MPRKPKQWVPSCPEALGDEIFRFVYVMFNVTRAKAIVADGRPTEMVKISDLESFLPSEDPNKLKFGIAVDRELAMGTDPSVPGIVAYIRDMDGKYSAMLIDGWHRAYKARHEGLTELPVYVMTEAESDKVRVR